MIHSMLRRLAIPSWLLAAPAVALLAACGGSGSSGFDRGGFDAEVIDRAIAEGRCIPSAGELFICPSGAAVPAPTGGEPAPVPAGLRIAANAVGPGVDCPESGCGVRVALEITELPQGAEIRIAARAARGEPWRVGSPLALQLPSDGSGVIAPVGVDLGGGVPPESGVELAVLLFLPPLGEVPASVGGLAETGADYAFVLEVGQP